MLRKRYLRKHKELKVANQNIGKALNWNPNDLQLKKIKISYRKCKRKLGKLERLHHTDTNFRNY